MGRRGVDGSFATKLPPALHRGSVKDVLGPLVLAPGSGNASAAANGPSAVFEYTDAFSVFDWGRMPDALASKGQALCVLAAHWFERLEDPATWKEFSKSQIALDLRRSARVGSAFNELGEELQAKGLRTHYQGVLGPEALGGKLVPLAELDVPVRHLVVQQVSVVKPVMATVLGRSLPDYTPTRNSPRPKLVPLEVVFRFGCPEGSSILERASRDPGYMASIGFGHCEPKAGARWDFPVLELFTKLESTDRPVPLIEALAISGLAASELQDVLLKTAWVAGCVRWMCSKAGVELADGKLEWGLSEKGEIFLVDAIGPDELRLLVRPQGAAPGDGVQLSKEFLRQHYRRTSWYRDMNDAKSRARDTGQSDWKKLVAEGPPPLPADLKRLASELYLALTNRLTGKLWFPNAMSLDEVVAGLRKVESGT